MCALASNSTRSFSAETARAISRHFSASCRYASTVLFCWNLGLIGMTMRGWPFCSSQSCNQDTGRRGLHQAALLLGCLGRADPHVCPADRLADGFSVSSIILVSLDVGPRVSGRHQAHHMTESLQFARPMMRRGAGFDANEARTAGQKPFFSLRL